VNGGLLWIAFELIDVDAPTRSVAESPDARGLSINDEWTEPCSAESPSSVRDWMPLGMQQDNTDQLRELPTGVCERVIALRISGLLGGELVINRPVPWQPGKNGGRWLGVPREGTTNINIRFPKAMRINERFYDVPDSVVVRTGGNERLIVVVVPLRRLAVVSIHSNNNGKIFYDKSVTASTDSETALPYGTRLLRAKKGYKMFVNATDRDNSRQIMTSPSYPETIMEIPAHYGWRFDVELVPNQDGRKGWIAALRRNKM